MELVVSRHKRMCLLIYPIMVMVYSLPIIRNGYPTRWVWSMSRRYNSSVPGECLLKYYLVGGESLKEVLGNYTTLTGKPALPPAWSFGLWLTTSSFTTSYDEATVNRFVDGMLERDVPLHVFHFDCFWMKEFQWCDFKWDEDVFPDPAGMLKRLKAKVTIRYLRRNQFLYCAEVLFVRRRQKKGYFVKNNDGSVGSGIDGNPRHGARGFYQSECCSLVQGQAD